MKKSERTMRLHKITAGGQISLPAVVRARWGTKSVGIEDHGNAVIVRPLPDDPIAAARGPLRGQLAASEDLRAEARADEAGAEARR